MLYPSHGYIDILNHEIRHSSSNTLKLVTKTHEIIFKDNKSINYNAANFTNKILQKVLYDLNSQKVSCKNLQVQRSILKLSPKNETRFGKGYHEYNLKFKVYPSETTAHIVIEEFSIIAFFKNEMSCLKKDIMLNKKYNFEESQSQLLILPQHNIQVPLTKCTSYNTFKSIILDAVYKDIASIMAQELNKIHLPKWDIDLSSTNLDVKNIVTDNIQVLIA